MAIDEEHDDGFGGRSSRRRAISESWRWGYALIDLPAWHLAAIPMPDELRAAVDVARTLASIPARNRQVRQIEGWLRDMDEEERHALRTAMLHAPEGADPDSVVKAWTERLTTDGDAAIDALIAAYPTADRQQARAIVRGKKPASLEKMLRGLIGA